VFRAGTTLWQHRSFLGAVLLRSTILVALVALLLPATYESKTELMPPDQQSGAASMLAALMGGGSSTSSLTSSGPSMSSGVMGMASDLLGLKTSGALFIRILSRDAAQDKLINRYDLRREYWISTDIAARK